MKVCFVSDGLSSKFLLDVYRKMTPGKSGKWKDMEGVSSIEDADFCVIIDNTKQDIPVEKRVYISAHPIGYPNYYDPPKGTYAARINYKDTSGFLEWWLKYDYDELSSMKQPSKKKTACCILSNAREQDYQKDRIEFMESFFTRYSKETVYDGLVHVYGRIKPTGEIGYQYCGELGSNRPDSYWWGKEILADYNYSIEFDAYGENYFSERLADSLLMWCFPLYRGGTGIERHLPLGSFKYLTTIDDLAETLKSYDYVNANKDITEARNMILNELQLWPKVYNTLCSL